MPPSVGRAEILPRRTANIFSPPLARSLKRESMSRISMHGQMRRAGTSVPIPSATTSASPAESPSSSGATPCPPPTSWPSSQSRSSWRPHPCRPRANRAAPRRGCRARLPTWPCGQTCEQGDPVAPQPPRHLPGRGPAPRRRRRPRPVAEPPAAACRRHRRAPVRARGDGDVDDVPDAAAAALASPPWPPPCLPHCPLAPRPPVARQRRARPRSPELPERANTRDDTPELRSP